MEALFATDGAHPARTAESLVTSLFGRDVGIHAYTVSSDPRRDWLVPVEDLEHARMDVPVIGGDQVASEGADRLGAKGFEPSFASNRGAPGPEIVREAEAQGVGVIVLGASHHTWMGNLLLGSVSTYVLHHASCSVLVAHRPPLGSGTVLFGTDGSEQASSALSLATKLLDSSRCSFQVASAVVDPLAHVAVYPPRAFLGNTREYGELEKRRMDNTWDVVNQACGRLQALGFKADGTVLSGSPTHQLLKESDNVSADLVVVGARGRGPVSRGLFGSVSDQLVRHAPATLVGHST